MLLFLKDALVTAWSEDDSLITSPEYGHLDNVVLVSELKEMPQHPNDGYYYEYHFIDGEVVSIQKEKKPLPPITNEQLKQDTTTIHQTTQASSIDNIINMDMLLELDEKLNKLLEHLGLN